MPCDGGYMSGIRPPKMCGLFRPGHNPHWIQIGKGLKDDENLSTPARFIESRLDGSIVIEVDGQELHLWNHEPERLAEAAAANGGAIEHRPRWGLVLVPSMSGRYVFSVTQSLFDFLPCPTPPSFGRPVNLLESAGGFTVKVDDSHGERS